MLINSIQSFMAPMWMRIKHNSPTNGFQRVMVFRIMKWSPLATTISFFISICSQPPSPGHIFCLYYPNLAMDCAVQNRFYLFIMTQISAGIIYHRKAHIHQREENRHQDLQGHHLSWISLNLAGKIYCCSATRFGFFQLLSVALQTTDTCNFSSMEAIQLAVLSYAASMVPVTTVPNPLIRNTLSIDEDGRQYPSLAGISESFLQWNSPISSNRSTQAEMVTIGASARKLFLLIGGCLSG